MKLQITNTVDQNFRDFIVTQKHPCIMANTVFKMENYHLKVYDDLTSSKIFNLFYRT